ncbi:MAG TPA: alpha/beta fold hydrolase [Candidatus Limnocylindrales bacterium]|nr:alpha/beta fold hydrolase [Candidatus Limnocylindrales bacterium]
MRFQMPGMSWTDHTFQVPLDHDDPASPHIEVFARELVAGPQPRPELPMLVFLQGGPGMRADRPTSTSAWLLKALTLYRVLLLDQRGTGRSTPATRQSLARFDGPSPIPPTVPPSRGPKAQADYLRHFRADAIVRDAELIRHRLLGDEPWSVLGQSYGGFCATTYLSFAPHGLREVMITGGLPGLTAQADDVYRAAYPRILAHNERYFSRYPGDKEIVEKVLERLGRGDYPLSPQRFRMVGTMLGHSKRVDELHFLLEDAFIGDELSDVFLRGVDAVVSQAAYPLYALMHESIYCQGGASNWSAHRILGEFDEFGSGTNLFGELVFPWMFDEDPALEPLKECAHELAARDDWPRLYDVDQLARNKVPVAATVYFDDLYVDRGHSLQTAGVIRGLRPWITNEFVHNGLGADERVFERLHAMVRGEA